MTNALHTGRPIPVVLVMLLMSGHSALALAGITMDQVDGAGRAIAAAPCAQPDAVRREPRVNRHNPRNTDQIVYTECAGIQVEHLQVQESGRLFVRMLRLATPDARLPAGLQPGQPVAPARTLLGELQEHKSDRLRYLLPGAAGSDHFSVEADDGRIRALVWTWWVD